MVATLAPGNWVALKTAPDWGRGQVQSVAGHRVTVNFEHGGKRLIHTDVIILDLLEPERTDHD